MLWDGDMVWVLIPIVMFPALFTFLGVNSWAAQRRKEREAYYRYEFRKKLVEVGEMNTAQMQEIMRFEVATALLRQRQGMIAGGLITTAVGAGLMLGLRFIDDIAIWMVGYIPLLMGVAMLAYGFLFAHKSVPVPLPGSIPPGEKLD